MIGDGMCALWAGRPAGRHGRRSDTGEPADYASLVNRGVGSRGPSADCRARPAQAPACHCSLPKSLRAGHRESVFYG
jgi:hypothetical protein